MNHYLAIAGLVVVTIIWGGGFVASDMALESASVSDYGNPLFPWNGDDGSNQYQRIKGD